MADFINNLKECLEDFSPVIPTLTVQRKDIEKLIFAYEDQQKKAAAGTATLHNFDVIIDGQTVAHIVINENSRIVTTSEGITTTVL